jgi:hypothetical protein
LAGLSYLVQPGGLLSNLPSSITAAELQSASPEDVATLGLASLQSQEIDVLFGIPQNTQNAPPAIPFAPTATSAGVASADLADATPEQQATIQEQALQQQQLQSLFGEPATTNGAYNLIA